MKNKLVFSSLLLILVYTSCKRGKEPVLPEEKMITETVYASGVLVPENEYTLRAQAEGIIRSIYVKEGDTVAAGKVLLEIVNDRMLADRDAASEIYRTTLQNTGSSSPALAELESRLVSARARVHTDSISYLRYKKLYAEKAATPAELEQAELRYTQSRADVSALRRQTENLRLNLENERSRARGSFLSAESSSDFRMPRALYTSMVYELSKKTGDYVRPGDALALMGAGQLVARLKIDESDFARVRPGQKVLISGDVFGEKIIEGQVLRVLPRMNEREQAFTVEAAIPATGLGPVYGLNCEADIVVAEERKALLVPKRALLPGDSLRIAIGKKEQKTVKVRTGLISGNYAEILDGIDKQTPVILP